MNDTEQYHCGRAAAYATMASTLKQLLREHSGQIPRDAVQKLMFDAESWSISAEFDANQAMTPATAS